MSEATDAEPATFQHLGDGLVLLAAKIEDREPLAAFHANTLLDVNERPP